MYDEIKKNIIERFFNNYYLWTCCNNRDVLLSDINKRIPFDVRYPNFSDYETIEMNLGDNIKITIKLKWEKRTFKNSIGNEIINYRLINIY